MNTKKDINDVLFIITAREQSTRVPLKMTSVMKDRNGKETCLFEIAICKILTSKIIPREQFFVSLYEEDTQLVSMAKKHNVNIYYRSKESAYAEKSLQVCFEWWNKLPFKYVVFFNACHPFVKVETIDNFITTYLESDSFGLFGVIKKKNYFFSKDHKLITPWPKDYKILNTKAVEETFEAAHTLYASKMDTIGHDIFMGTFLSENDPQLFEMDEFECFDVDYPWQFTAARLMYSEMY